MKRVVSNMDEQIGTWLAGRIPHFDLGDSPYTAIGLLDQRGYIHAGVVYSVFTGNDIVMHVALLNRRALTRRFIEEAFKYPFLQLNTARVTAMVAAGNQASHDFVKRLGFRREGCLREWYADGQDGILYGMLRRECRWIHPRRRYGKPNAGASAGPQPAHAGNGGAANGGPHADARRRRPGLAGSTGRTLQ